ncbi:MAG: signal peptidase I [Candidatus Omnitrophica bacterium]|nr:signal peptidase I [Candidatus Omnitrophota bacterium]MDD5352322.1 signal peptidase I [Candidatus Omnitrophota bacterium]MDD5549920.1 signal peptidase I [Candidatus Omnitrophota bacterium]
MNISVLKNQLKNKMPVIREWLDTIIVATLLALFIRSFIVQPFKIPTGSMRETLLEGDRIFVNRFIYGLRIPFTDIRIFKFNYPQKGDVIVFNYPEDIKRAYIKRMIGKGGDVVEIKDGRVYVNSKEFNNPAVRNIYYYNRGDYGLINQKITVPKDSYFVLGDNSHTSKDSRYWGFVPDKYLIGKAFLIYWPLNRIRVIK